MSLRHLLIKPGKGPFPTAAQHNGVRDHLLHNRLLGPVPNILPAKPYPHPWQVTVARFEPTATSTLAADSTWSVKVVAGTIMDRIASIPYLRKNDPRGWVPPDGYVEPVTIDTQAGTAPNSTWLDRDALDDPDAPPFLVLRDPAQGAKTAPDLTLIPDAQRNGLEGGAFTGAADWALELWRAHVILSATPFMASSFKLTLPPPSLVRYRLYTVAALPLPTVGVAAGGSIELATLYLLRDPKVPATAEIRVREREFFSLWSQVVEPGSDLAGLFGDGVDQAFSDAATVEFWSV